MRLRRFALAVVVVSTTATACGDSPTSTDSTGSVAASPTIAAPVTTAVPIGPGTGTEFCDYQTELNNLDTPFDHADATPADFEKFYTETVPAALAHSAELAPAELQADIAKVNEGITALGAALAANGWDAATAYNDPAMQAVLGDTAFEQASTVIDSYCGFGTEGADI
ncbi:MAG: hypothetical protein ABMA25_06020 [Ilumatobacteraceae bacterium]